MKIFQPIVTKPLRASGLNNFNSNQNILGNTSITDSLIVNNMNDYLQRLY